MKYYLSGKISNGDTETHTFEHFDEMEDRLRLQGHEVFNPVKLEQEGAPWEYYLARDVKWIMDNRPIMFMLEGWEGSRGARLEHELGKLLGLEIEYA